MGGDGAPVDLFKGVLEAADSLTDAQLIVIGTQDEIDRCQTLPQHPRVHFTVAKEEISMDESPLLAVRRKKKSSIAIGTEMLRSQECDAFVSAGNTGALTAFSNFVLKKIPGIDRPALSTLLPTECGQVIVLDIGANIILKPCHLMQFALMGAAFQRAFRQIKRPRIGLLNIGGEARKGTYEARQAYEHFNHYAERLEENNLVFEGNIESQAVFEGRVDVLVTDGFTGNIFLKTCEGVSNFIIDQIHKRFLTSQSAYPRDVLQKVERTLDYAEYPGAVLLGVEAVVVKCHGRSCARAMANGIQGAYRLVKNQTIPQISTYLKESLQDFLQPLPL